MKRYKFRNNLSSEKFDEFDIDSLPANSMLKSIMELQNKENELKKIKYDLIKYTSALKNLEIVKNAKNHFQTQENKNFKEETDKGINMKKND